MATKIFIRKRRKIEKGEKKPRFRVVGIGGSDVKLYVKHIRKNEIEQISKETFLGSFSNSPLSSFRNIRLRAPIFSASRKAPQSVRWGGMDPYSAGCSKKP